MLTQINLYLIIGLFIAVLVLGGGWYLNNKIKTSEIAALNAEKATLTESVERQERTIEQMVRDAQVLADANKQLMNRIVTSEMEFVDEWSATNSLDLESDDATGNVDELERVVNDRFMASIEALRAATAK